jgi:hypothetical protein
MKKNSQRDRNREIKSVLLTPVLLIMYCVVFKKRFADMITVVFVKPLFASLHHSTIVIDLVFLLIAGWVIYVFVHKGFRRISLSLSMIAYSLTLLILYLLYRFPAGSWYSYVSFRLEGLSKLMLADVLLVPLAGILIYCLIRLASRFFRGHRTLEPHAGFYTDSALILDENNDDYGRLGYILELKEKLLATKATDSSFAIGIVGEWGSGKTTFIQTLEKLLEKENDVIQIRFNPWAIPQKENLTAIFFQDLAVRLSEYDDTLKKKFGG